MSKDTESYLNKHQNIIDKQNSLIYLNEKFSYLIFLHISDKGLLYTINDFYYDSPDYYSDIISFYYIEGY